MNRTRRCVKRATSGFWIVSACLASSLLPGDAQARPNGPTATFVVTTTAELEAALTPSNAGAQIVVRAGDYDLSHALTLPDQATLAGEGVMSFDDSGLPTGFEPSGRTLLRSTAALVGDVLTLGDGTTVRGLVIEDVPGRQTGNPVAVVSRAAGDFVSVHIEECEIVNPNPPGRTPRGPTGRGVVVYTTNPNLGFEPPPHDGAELRLQMARSIVRSPGAGTGIFAFNFASHAGIDLDLEDNTIGGGLDAGGGISRPDGVTGSSTIIQSRRNLYRSDSSVPAAIGWNLLGGTGAPLPGLVSQATTSNSLRLHSTDDRIEGFGLGVSAAGSVRMSLLSESSSGNRLELDLQGTLLQTTVADLELLGAATFVPSVSPGDENTVHVVMRQASGSGLRANQYAHSAGGLGTGNRLEIVGSANAFAQTNDGFDPIPPAEFFTAQR